MVLNRDEILKDLRHYVIEFTFKDKPVQRLTLRPDLLPSTYSKDINEEKEFHNNNPEFIAAWNVSKPGGWLNFNINTISYLQIIDGY